MQYLLSVAANGIQVLRRVSEGVCWCVSHILPGGNICRLRLRERHLDVADEREVSSEGVKEGNDPAGKSFFADDHDTSVS